jgi:hypothetical protein
MSQLGEALKVCGRILAVRVQDSCFDNDMENG